MATSLEMTRTYSSFSGVDIRAVINGTPFGRMRSISYGIQREKAPNYVMGSADPISYSRGKRGIVGVITALMLDSHLVYSDAFKNMRFIADNAEIMPNTSDLNNAEDNDITTAGGVDPLDPFASFDASNLSGEYTASKPWYVDQLPPFDAVLVAVSEYGRAAQMRIYGIEILNEGSGFSIDDMSIDNQMTYAARTVMPWQPMGSWATDSSGNLTNTFESA